MKKRDFYDAITGDIGNAEDYGKDTSVFRKVDNVSMVFDSRGQYLGIRTSRGKFIDDKYTIKKGPYDFKSFLDFKIWAGQECRKTQFIETKDGTFMQIETKKI